MSVRAAAAAVVRKAIAPAAAPVVKYPVMYLDLAPHWHMFQSIFYWMDCAQASFWGSSAIPVLHRDEYLEMFNDSCVMRCNTCQVYDHQRLASLRREIHIRPWLSRIGKSSWVMSFEMLTPDVDGSEVLAHASTVMVSVDSETHSRSQPLPHRQVLVDLLESQDVAAVDLSHVSDIGEVDVVADNEHKSAFQARLVDCDHFNHINNAVFPKLAEEARAIAVAARGFDDRVIQFAASPAVTCHVDYLQQVYPHETITTTTSLVASKTADPSEAADSRVFQVKLCNDAGELCSSVLLGVEHPNPRLPGRLLHKL